MARKLILQGIVEGLDDETFGADERGRWNFNQSTVFTNQSPLNVLDVSYGWGGECRAEIHLKGVMRSNGGIDVTGETLLYEGTSERSMDLDGKKAIQTYIPRGKSVSVDTTVYNEDEGGDYAKVSLQLTNMLIETDEDIS